MANLDILKAIDDQHIFGTWFRDPTTWRVWRVYLSALFALPLDADQLALFQEFTGRQTAPTTEFNESYLICGRRSGKSAVLAVTAVFLSIAREYRELLAPGEVATIRIMAADRDQARSIFRYVGALLKDNPMLAPLVLRETGESFELNNRVVIEVGTASFRASRGYSYAAVLADELAFWRSDESTNPDVEILRALRPGLLTSGRQNALRIITVWPQRILVGGFSAVLRQRRRLGTGLEGADAGNESDGPSESDIAANMSAIRHRLRPSMARNSEPTLRVLSALKPYRLAWGPSGSDCRIGDIAITDLPTHPADQRLVHAGNSSQSWRDGGAGRHSRD